MEQLKISLYLLYITFSRIVCFEKKLSENEEAIAETMTYFKANIYLTIKIILKNLKSGLIELTC